MSRITDMGLVLQYEGNVVQKGETVIHYNIEKIDTEGGIDNKMIAIPWTATTKPTRNLIRAIFQVLLDYAEATGEIAPGIDEGDI